MPTPLKLLAISIAAALAACSVEPITFKKAPVAVGGTVSGLAGTGLVLTNNGGDDLPITGNGAFVFATLVERGAGYALAVKTQPTSPAQECTIANGSGTAGDADITDVRVSCRTLGFDIGGTVAGLAGTGLVLQNNGADSLAITADGAFTFVNQVPSGGAYDVTVAMQPALPTQECTVANGSGTVGSAAVTDVAVACQTRSFTIGGTVTGLAGSGLVLQNNGGDSLSIAANGTFTFATPVPSGEAFAVTILTQPSGPTQTCTVSGGTGTVGGGDVTSVAIDCTTNAYTIGGTISGLAGGTVTLRNNGGNALNLTANGTFAFSTPVLSGGTYNVTVQTQPTMPWQTCVVTAGSGTVTNANITSVVVTCTTNRYRIGGTLTGLAPGNSITLRNNGGDNLVRSANGTFQFATTVASGQTYAVTVLANPTSPIAQTCVVANGSGMVAGADVTNVQITCTTNTYTIGGTVAGLTGAGLVLRNNGGNDLAIAANGPFTFSAAVASGAAYNVTVQAQPSGQTCKVESGAGTVGASNVTTVAVTCSRDWSTSIFPIAVPGTTNTLGDLVLDGNADLLTVLATSRSIVRVSRIDGTQTQVATGIGAGSFLLGVTYRAANDMIYTNTDTQILAVTPGGSVSLLLDGITGFLNAITIAPPSFAPYGGFIIGVTQAGTLIAVNPANAALTTFATGVGAASDLAFAPDGTLYISGATTVRTVTAGGAVTTFASGFSSADGITITPDGGRAFVADSGTDTVRQVTLPGAAVTTFAAADIDGGFGVGGILAAPGNTLIVITGTGSLTLRAFTY